MKNLNKVLIIANAECPFKNFSQANVSKSAMKNIGRSESHKSYCYECATYQNYRDFLYVWGLANYFSAWWNRKLNMLRYGLLEGVRTQVDSMRNDFRVLSIFVGGKAFDRLS